MRRKLHSHFKPMIEKVTFIQMVETAKEHIVKGDIFQVVLSQRFTSPFEGNPFTLYRQLRTSNPSPYMFYMDFETYTISWYFTGKLSKSK